MPLIDTLTLKTGLLEGGVPEPQAAAIVRALADLRAEMRAEVADVRTEVAAVRAGTANVRTKIADVRTEVEAVPRRRRPGSAQRFFNPGRNDRADVDPPRRLEHA